MASDASVAQLVAIACAFMGAYAAVVKRTLILAEPVYQYLQDVAPFVKCNLPVRAVAINNNELGKISKDHREG